MEDLPRIWSLDLHPGKYVAVDMRDDRVVLTADSSHELSATSEPQVSRDFIIIREPMGEEPLPVGPG